VVTPKRKQILKRARERSIARGVLGGLPAITPEDYELRETGGLLEAQRDLMRSEASKYSGQQRSYLMAGEMGLKILTRREFTQAEKGMGKVGFKWINGWGETKAKKPPMKKISLRDQAVVLRTVTSVGEKARMQRRKRQKNHSQRVGKTMRKLRKIDGVKVFSFPDSVWKIRKIKRKR